MKLSDLPGDWDWSQYMGWTCRYMLETGFEEWGFLIYRCAYGDDDTWDRYMAYLREAVHEDLVYQGREHLMEQYARWSVVEDRAALDGASRQQVRRRFVEWRDQNSVSRQLPVGQVLAPLLSDTSPRLPRFTCCLYVDQECLDTLQAHADAKAAAKALGRIPPLIAVVIDGDFSDQQSSPAVPSLFDYPAGFDDHHPPIDGCKQRYVGWEYFSARYLASLYDDLHQVRMDDDLDYKRPPAIAPGGTNVMENGVVKLV